VGSGQWACVAAAGAAAASMGHHDSGQAFREPRLLFAGLTNPQPGQSVSLWGSPRLLLGRRHWPLVAARRSLLLAARWAARRALCGAL